MASSIPIGVYEVEEIIGSGGMGAIWKGRHIQSGVPVAIKVLKSRSGVDRLAQDLFATEVRAVAALNHPGIVMVLDHGQISAESEHLSDGELSRGTPYLVMELCSGGTLAAHRGLLGWPRVRPVLLALLDALAHAHARGVIHRDIKPSNVLIGTGLDSRRGLKLTDFGIAQLRDPSTPKGETSEFLFASPPYAPPEQLLGHTGEMGPASDLYSLGCLGWALCCGSAPHGGLPLRELVAHRLAGNFPEFEPLQPVPEAFIWWLQKLLASRPEERFDCAADAAWELRGLAPEEDGEELTDCLSQGSALLFDSSLTSLQSENSLELPTLVAQASQSARGVVQLERADAPGLSSESNSPGPQEKRQQSRPLPEDWRRAEMPQLPMRLVGAGRGLFAFRTIPMVGRGAERDRIWKGLHDVVRHNRASGVLLRGPAGTGKSRLVQWMTERAGELGAASVFHVRHGPRPGLGDGLGAAVGRYLGLDGRDASQVLTGTSLFFQRHAVDDPFLEAACCELISPGCTSRDGDDPRQGHSLSSREERWQVLLSLLELEARRRPVILWVDDAQWGGDSVGFVLKLLRQRELDQLPVLAVVTCRAEVFSEDSGESQLLSELSRHRHCASLQVAPLEPELQLQLVTQLLRLDEALAREVVDRSAGNPLYARQLVGDWLQRDLLEITSTGFVRREGVVPEVPDDIHELWMSRFEDCLSSAREKDWEAAEVAAALGSQFNLNSWLEAAPLTELELAELADLLLRGGLMISEGGQLAFVHGMARESLERHSRDEGRWQKVQLLCAAGLAHSNEPADVARRARHLLEAQAFDQALPILRTAVRLLRSHGAMQEASELLDKTLIVLERLKVPALHYERLEARLERIEVWRALGNQPDLDTELESLLGDIQQVDDPRLASLALREKGVRLRGKDFAEGERCLRESLRLAERSGDHLALGRACTSLAWVALIRGNFAQSIELFHRGRRETVLCGDRSWIAVCYMGLCEAYARAGNCQQARQYGEHAVATAAAAGGQARLGDALMHLARVELDDGNLNVGLEMLRRSLEAMERTGLQGKLISTHNLLGEAARKAGRFDAAEQSYLEAVAIADAIDTEGSWQPRLNLGLLAMEAGRFAGARLPVEKARHILERTGRQVQLQWADILLIPALLGDGDLEALESCLTLVEEVAGRWSRPVPDCLQALKWAVPMAQRSKLEVTAKRVAALEAAYREQIEAGKKPTSTAKRAPSSA